MKDNARIEILKYKKDKVSYTFVMLGLFLNVIYFVNLYKHNDNYFYNIQMGLSIIYNLLFMLLLFLCAENIKVYNRRYAFVIIFVSLLQIIRIMFIPKHAYDDSAIDVKDYQILFVFLSLSSISLMIAGFNSYLKSTSLKRYIEGEKNGIS